MTQFDRIQPARLSGGFVGFVFERAQGIRPAPPNLVALRSHRPIAHGDRARERSFAFLAARREPVLRSAFQLETRRGGFPMSSSDSDCQRSFWRCHELGAHRNRTRNRQGAIETDKSAGFASVYADFCVRRSIWIPRHTGRRSLLAIAGC